MCNACQQRKTFTVILINSLYPLQVEKETKPENVTNDMRSSICSKHTDAENDP